MHDKVSWFIKIWQEDRSSVFGVGECGPLPGLSVDAVPELESVIAGVVEKINATDPLTLTDIRAVVPPGFPSVLFAAETAFLDLQNGGERIIFDNGFLRGVRIPINGLIWMGDLDFMMDQINQKVRQGFRCLKLKVGGLDFEREYEVLEYIRKRYFREELVIRLDANGAFKPAEALSKLNTLARIGIDSIEQPVRPGEPVMEELCRASPIPVALDEELIGVEERQAKVDLLDRLRPPFIILKPTLHGGLRGSAEWIALAEERNIGWWITSALESSIGLNAICQFTANYSVTRYQGLGTGMIYNNNFSSPLNVEDGHIFMDKTRSWPEDFELESA
jgi:o-succinylbenzoate synthase